MKITSAIKKLTEILEEYGDLELYIGDYCQDDEGEEYSLRYEIDFISTMFWDYAYMEKGDEV